MAAGTEVGGTVMVGVALPPQLVTAKTNANKDMTPHRHVRTDLTIGDIKLVCATQPDCSFTRCNSMPLQWNIIDHRDDNGASLGFSVEVLPQT